MIKKTIYEYDAEKVFLKETTEKYNQFDGSLILPQFYTEVKPTFDSSTDFARFNTDKRVWEYFPMWERGVYYDKRNGDAISVITSYDARDKLQYTHIEPPQYNEGDLILFNEEINDWEFTVKGDITNTKDIESAKALKIKECEKFYTDLRLFNVVNGHIAKFSATESDVIALDENGIMVKHYGCDSLTSNIFCLKDKADSENLDVNQLVYNYIIDINGFVSVPYLKLIEIRQKIGEQRYKCAVLRILHNATINELTKIIDINGYNFTKDIRPTLLNKTLTATKISDIKID